jgi:hypothetical protein
MATGADRPGPSFYLLWARRLAAAGLQGECMGDGSLVGWFPTFPTKAANE